MPDRRDKTPYQSAIRACVLNGRRLLADADLVHGWDHHGTAYALAVLAQEEFAKAFLLFLVQDSAIPWTKEVRWAVRDHKCKHLLSMLMDYLAARGENWLEEFKAGTKAAEPIQLPTETLAVINLFRHEKIGRMEDRDWDVLEPNDYSRNARSVAEGSVDRAKQSAIYVNVGGNGEVISTPDAVTPSQAAHELERCRRVEELASDIESGYVAAFREYATMRDIFHAVFDPTAIAKAIIQPIDR